ncbi:hypothetical protein J3F83DRAFT_746384 [Trichoderma novae-zelandiae]
MLRLGVVVIAVFSGSVGLQSCRTRNHRNPAFYAFASVIRMLSYLVLSIQSSPLSLAMGTSAASLTQRPCLHVINLPCLYRCQSTHMRLHVHQSPVFHHEGAI